MNSAICFLRRFLGRRTGLSSRAEQGLPYSHRSSIVLQQRTYINCIEPFPEWTAHSLGRRDLWISELEGATASARPSTQCGMVRLNAFHRWTFWQTTFANWFSVSAAEPELISLI